MPVAPLPDSLKIWFYREKRHEEGKAFGCLVRVGGLDPVPKAAILKRVESGTLRRMKPVAGPPITAMGKRPKIPGVPSREAA
jgi:hypothetical protein